MLAFGFGCFNPVRNAFRVTFPDRIAERQELLDAEKPLCDPFQDTFLFLPRDLSRMGQFFVLPLKSRSWRPPACGSLDRGWLRIRTWQTGEIGCHDFSSLSLAKFGQDEPLEIPTQDCGAALQFYVNMFDQKEISKLPEALSASLCCVSAACSASMGCLWAGRAVPHKYQFHA
jgi:hypothetical protein